MPDNIDQTLQQYFEHYITSHQEHFDALFQAAVRQLLLHEILAGLDRAKSQMRQEIDAKLQDFAHTELQQIFAECSDDVRRYAEVNLKAALDRAITGMLDKDFLEDAVSTKIQKRIGLAQWRLVFEENESR